MSDSKEELALFFANPGPDDKEEFGQAFEESCRLREIEKVIDGKKNHPVETKDDEDEELLRALIPEADAIKKWLQGERGTPSEFNSNLPILLRSKTIFKSKERADETVRRLRAAGMDAPAIAKELKRLDPAILPSRIGRLLTHDPAVTIAPDTYRVRGIRLLEKTN